MSCVVMLEHRGSRMNNRKQALTTRQIVTPMERKVLYTVRVLPSSRGTPAPVLCTNTPASVHFAPSTYTLKPFPVDLIWVMSDTLSTQTRMKKCLVAYIPSRMVTAHD